LVFTAKCYCQKKTGVCDAGFVRVLRQMLAARAGPSQRRRRRRRICSDGEATLFLRCL
jgi:hypothetical protein